MFFPMLVILTFIVLFLIIFAGKDNPRNIHRNNVIILAGLTLFVRLVSTMFMKGHPTDVNCFISWAEMLAEHGMGQFYTLDVFNDYPPGYMYVLYIVGHLRQFLNIPLDGYTIELLIKMPAIICDMASVIILYTAASKRFAPTDELLSKNKLAQFSGYLPSVIAVLYALNPAVILDSAVWGQVDSVMALLIVISLYFMVEKKNLRAYLLFVAAIFVKPQALMFSPVYIFYGLHYIYISESRPSALADVFLWFVDCIGLAVLLALPFALTPEGINFVPIIDQYKDTLASYPYVTVNAYNLYCLFGLNWKPVTDTFFIITFDQLGIILLVLTVLLSFFLLHRNRSKSNFFFVAALINICTFTLSVKMHERYGFTVLLLLLFAYIYKRSKRLLILYGGFTLGFFLNYLDILRLVSNDNKYETIRITSILFSVITVLMFIFALIYAFAIYMREKQEKREAAKPQNETDEESIVEIDIQMGEGVYSAEEADDVVSEDASDDNSNGEPPEDEPESDNDGYYEESAWRAILDSPQNPPESPIRRSKDFQRMTLRDYLLMAAVTLVYAVVAFARLGDDFAPETQVRFLAGQEVIIAFDQPYEISKFQFYLGARTDQKFNIYYGRTEEETYIVLQTDSSVEDDSEMKAEGVFKWFDIGQSRYAQYARIKVKTTELFLYEIAFRDSEGALIPIASISDGFSELVDEQELVPEMRTFMNSTYFDEIYHSRTGYEFIEKLKVYEWTHPPLGKVIISWGISLFGMNPFGWRFFGTLFGVLMLPCIYLFGKRMFGKTLYAGIATVAFAFDFMHFAQTRISTIDTYITIFVILMYYFMYRYYMSSFYDKKLWKTLGTLFMSGLFMGLGIASKWPGVYAAIGLAIILFITLIQRYKEFVYANEQIDSGNATREYLHISRVFTKYTVITLLSCVVFFVIVPLIIYLVSYIPYYATNSLYPVRSGIRILNDSKLAAFLMPDNKFGNYCAAVVQNQLDIFNYHAKLVSTHPYSAPWYTWPLDIRPIFYYSASFGGYVRAGISSFGNPAVWWGGFLALCYAIYTLPRKVNRNGLFLIIAWAAQIVPWMFVSRTTYIYHYFPCVPFIVLLIAHFFESREGGRFINKGIIAFIVAVLVLFVLFYPILSGLPVDYRWAKALLEWFGLPWQLI